MIKLNSLSAAKSNNKVKNVREAARTIVVVMDVAINVDVNIRAPSSGAQKRRHCEAVLRLGQLIFNN